MVSNQTLSSISISEWNQILHPSHLLTIVVVSGSCHALCLSCSLQGCCVWWCRAFTAQRHPAKGVSESSIPAHTAPQAVCPGWLRVAFTQHEEHLYLVCSKMQYWQLPLSCRMHTPSSAFLCPFSPTIASLK